MGSFEDYIEIENDVWQLVAERIPEKTTEILGILSQDNSRELLEFIEQYGAEEQIKIGLNEPKQDRGDIQLYIFDNGSLVSIICLNTTLETLADFQLEQETFNNLLPLCIDIDEIMREAEFEIKMQG